MVEMVFFYFKTNRMFLADMSKAGRMSRYSPQTYDAVWAIALALRSAELHWRQMSHQENTLGRFDYSKNDMTLEFMRQMEQLNFLGVSVKTRCFPCLNIP